MDKTLVFYDITGARRTVKESEIEYILSQNEIGPAAGPFSMICRRKPDGGFDFIPLRIEKEVVKHTIERKINNA